MIRIIGIDPGMTGAVAWLDDGKFSGCFDMPVEKTGKRNRIDGLTLGAMFDGLLEPVEQDNVQIVLERLQPIKFGDDDKRGDDVPGQQGVYQAGKMMEAFGILQGVIMGKGFTFTLVTPQVWKKMQGLVKAKKDESRFRALSIHSNASSMLTRKRDQGRAEAILIADYYWNEVIRR